MRRLSDKKRVVPPIFSIGMENFEAQVLKESKPVLLVCMYKDSDYAQQMETVEGVCLEFGEALKVCISEEEFIDVFMERYGIKGTPTFVIFIDGCEKGRLLGQAETGKLREFILENLNAVNSG